MGKNTKRHKVSIITTFYNAEKFIINAISSVNQQIINGFAVEYVIVDDKSPDNSATIPAKGCVRRLFFLHPD